MKKLRVFGALALAACLALCGACAPKNNNDDPEPEQPEKPAPPVSQFVPASSGYTGTAEGVTFTLPDLGKQVVLHTELQSSYLKSPSAGMIEKYANGVNADAEAGLEHQELSYPVPVEFSWTAEGVPAGTEYTLSVSETSDMASPWTFQTEETSHSVWNLKIGTTYYWTVTAGDAVSGAASFSTEELGPRNLYVDGVANVRDLGGWLTQDSKHVKQGLIYRCGRLNENYTGKITISEAGIDTMLNTLGIKTELDLRGGANDPSEYGNIDKSMLGDTVSYHHIGMNWSGNMFQLNKAELKEIFTILADETSYPVIFHCSIGTDRTGVVAYLLNSLLGVQETDLIRDYLFSNFAYIEGARELSGLTKANSGIAWAVKRFKGETLADKSRAALLSLGLTDGQLDKIVEIFTVK